MKHKYPRIQKVIVSQIQRGAGTMTSPLRWVTQVHSLKGKFIAEFDEAKHQPYMDEK